MRVVTVRLRHGRRDHGVTEGSESPRTTLCGLAADGAVVGGDVPDCIRCLQFIARRSRRGG